MKQFSILAFALLISTTLTFAQKKGDVRTTETKVADLLMNLPAPNSKSLDESMKELVTLGEPGLRNITSKLQPPGKGNDEAMRFAISGLTKFVGKGDNKLQKRVTALTLANALKSAKDDEVRDFLLQEMQFVAGDEVVPIVSKYLLSKRLSDPAARVLSRVNTAPANNALLFALSTATGSQQNTLIEALGFTRYAPAIKKINQIYGRNPSANTQKVILHTLAQIGDPQSASLLKTAAQKTNFKFEPQDATNAYLLYLSRLLQTNQQQLAEKEARNLLSTSNLSGYIKSAALSILYKAIGASARPEIITALKSGDKQFRAAATGLLSKSYSAQTSAELQDLIKSSSDANLQEDLIYTLGENKDKNAVPLLASMLKSQNKNVQLAAIAAIAKAGQAAAVAPLIDIITQGDNELVSAAKQALLTIEGPEVAKKAAAALSQSKGAARTALLETVAQRGGTEYAAQIFEAANGNVEADRLAAVNGLAYVVGANDAPKLGGLLAKANTPQEKSALQNALFTAIKNQSNKADQVATVKSLMSANSANATNYYNILAAIGGKEALELVLNDYKNGNEAQKEAAVKALAQWSDQSALDALYQISKEANAGSSKTLALGSFIAGINKSNNPTDQKVLMFRNAMDLATTTAQKRNILKGIGENSSLLSLIFASKYLDIADLQQAAVQSVIAIATDHPELYGSTVDAIVKKALSLNKDGEAAYQKAALEKQMANAPKEVGYVSLFNGKDLSGWKGLVGNPLTRAKMTPEKLAEEQKKADDQMRKDWRVENGYLVFEGKGYNNLVSTKMYEDFEMIVDWKMEPKGDGGVYLRGSPQVQTWDTSRRDVGAQVGSGGLYNNQTHASKPLMVADNPINEWNTFRIKMVGDRVTVYLNGKLVTNSVVLENYWDRKIPIFDKEAIELQAHGTKLEFRDVYVKEIPRPKPYVLSAQEQKDGFVPLFNGVDMKGWTGNTASYFAEGGMIICDPKIPAPSGSVRNVFTDKEYSDFIMRFEFQLTPGANNGLGIRTPQTGDAAYEGMELQILDNDAPIYKDLKVYQYHGSVYGIIPSLRGFLKPVGEWNYQEVKAIGNRITITLNGKVILDGDIAKASKNNTATADGKPHPGLLNKSGYIGFLGHGSPLKFRNLRIKDLAK